MVLPCVPPMAIAWRKRISSASISARRTIGSSFSRAAFSSGLVFLIAVETTTTSAVAEVFGAVADEALDALVAQPLHIGAVGLVGALHAIAEIVQHLGDAAHADAADADEMHEADCLRHLHCRAPFLNS